MKEPFYAARCYLNSLMVVEILLALIIMIVTTMYYRILSEYIVTKDRKILFGQLLNFYIFGFEVMVLYTASLILWCRLWNLPYSRDVHLIVNLWLFVTTVILICGFGTVWSVSACIDEMEAAAETAMLNGIDNYYSYPDWKILWDELQFYRQCCGVNSYIDWKEAHWMSQLPLRSCKSGTSTTYAPYACCRRDRHKCYENFMPNSQHIGNVNVSFINTAGCLPLFTQNLWRLVYIVLGLLTVSLKLQAFVCVLVRFIMKRQNMTIAERQGLSGLLKRNGCDPRPRRSCLNSYDRLDAEAQTPLPDCPNCGGYLTVRIPCSNLSEPRSCSNCKAVLEPEVIH